MRFPIKNCTIDIIKKIPIPGSCVEYKGVFDLKSAISESILN